MRLITLTGCRPTEAMRADWSEFDEQPGFWIKPSAHTKQRKVHRLPLGPAAIELIERLRKKRFGRWVFPGDQLGEHLATLWHVWHFVRERTGLGQDARLAVLAGATDIVTIRNVQFQGNLGNGSSPNSAGLYGIQFASGAMLNIDNCKIDGFSQAGILAVTPANAILNVTNTTITNAPVGIVLEPSIGALNGSIDHTTIGKMSRYGILTIGSVYFTVTNSAIVNAAMSGVNASAGSVLEIESSSVSNNNTAFQTNGGTIRISRNTIYDNNTNFAINGGTIATGGNNFVAVNGATVPNGSLTQQ